MTLKVVVEQGEDGWLVGHVPELKGCWSQGRTQDELRANMEEAISLCLEVQQERLDRQKRSEIELVAA